MKNIVFILGIAFLSIYGCTSSTERKVAMENNVPAAPIAEVVGTDFDVQIDEVHGYFTSLEPSEPMVLLVNNQADFDNKFHPARTMTNEVTQINFDRMVVGAIILPETSYETRIVIDEVNTTGNTLHVSYHTEKENEKLSFTAIPQYLFSFNRNIEADSVHFEGDDLSVYLKK